MSERGMCVFWVPVTRLLSSRLPLIILSFFLLCSGLHAADYHWVPNRIGNWGDLENWTVNGQPATQLPQDGDTVMIAPGNVKVPYSLAFDGTINLEYQSAWHPLIESTWAIGTLTLGSQLNTTVNSNGGNINFPYINLSVNARNFGTGDDTPEVTNVYMNGFSQMKTTSLWIGAPTDGDYDILPSANVYFKDNSSLIVSKERLSTIGYVRVANGLLDMAGQSYLSGLDDLNKIGVYIGSFGRGNTQGVMNIREEADVSVELFAVLGGGTLNMSGGTLDMSRIFYNFGIVNHSAAPITTQTFVLGEGGDAMQSADSLIRYNQTGGSVTVNGSYYSGLAGQKDIVYSLSGDAALTVNGDRFRMGVQEKNHLNISDNATVAITDTDVYLGDLDGEFSSATGQFDTRINQTGGTFTVSNIASGVQFGYLGGEIIYNLSGNGRFASQDTSNVVFGNGTGNFYLRPEDGGESVPVEVASHGVLNLSGNAVFDISTAAIIMGVNRGRGTINQRGGSLLASNLAINRFDTGTSMYHFYGGDMEVLSRFANDGTSETGYLGIHGNTGGIVEINTLSDPTAGVGDRAGTRFYLDSSAKGVTEIDVVATAYLNTLDNQATVDGFANINQERYLLIDASAGALNGTRAVDTILSPYYETEINASAKTVSLVLNASAQGLEWNIDAQTKYILDPPLESGIIKVSGGDGENIILDFSNMTDTYTPLLLDYLMNGLKGSNLMLQILNKDSLVLSGDYISDPLGYTFFAWDLTDFNNILGLTGDGRIMLQSLSVPEPATWLMLLLGAVMVFRLRSRFTRR